jgi:hypothetical protein
MVHVWAGQVGGEYSVQERETQSCEPIRKKKKTAERSRQLILDECESSEVYLVERV